MGRKAETPKGKLRRQIRKIRETLDRLDKLPPALGARWRIGMIRYYERVLRELEDMLAEWRE